MAFKPTQLIEKSNNYRDIDLFATNEDLKEFIHGIHNFMRNNGFGYGKRALETFNFFYGLKLIENKLDTINFSENAEESKKYKEIFSYKKLVDLAEKRKQEGYSITKTTTITSKLETIINTLEDFNKKDDPREPIYKYIYHDIPNRKTSINEGKWRKIIIMINKLPVGYEKGRVNLSGKVYEYFIGKDKANLSDLGAYFTDRHITEKIYKKLNIQLDNKNNVKTMIDPFGGSGGFTLGYANYLMDNFKDKIDWKQNINNIYHFDMEEYVINMTGLEMFAKSNDYNFSPGNTFTRDLINGPSGNNTYDYVISNPPYGGDSVNKGGEQIKNDLLTVHLKKIMDETKTNMKKHITNTKKLNELVNSISRLNIIIEDTRSKKLYEQNTDKFKKIIDEYVDNEELNELINKYKKYNEQLSYLNYKLKKYKKEQEKMQVNYETCSKRIKKFVNNTNILIKKYDETDNKYIFINDKMRKEAINDKEACSLILLMDLLKKDGTCCAVLKEGVFFDNSYSELRNALINNYNVTDVISVPQDAFENTSTKTSIIIFKNNGKTEKITFSELKVNKSEKTIYSDEDNDGLIWKADLKKEFYENKEIYENLLSLENSGLIELNNWNYVSEVKDEIQSVEIVEICKANYKDLSKVTITKNKKGEEVRKCEYSLNYKNYNTYKHFIFTNDYELKIPENYTMLKFGVYFKFLQKSKHKASVGSDRGKYRFYTSSDRIKFSDICDIDDDKNKYLIFGTGGNGSLFIDNQFSCSTDNLVVVGKTNEETEYVYYYIKKYWKEFIKFNFNGSTMGHIKKENLINTQIPVPKDITTLKKELTQLQKLHHDISYRINS
jgi:type I restriction-modification system DNA methylase subunit